MFKKELAFWGRAIKQEHPNVYISPQENSLLAESVEEMRKFCRSKYDHFKN